CSRTAIIAQLSPINSFSAAPPREFKGVARGSRAMVAFVVPRNPAKGRSPATGPDLVHWLWWPGDYRRVTKKLQWRWPLVLCPSRGPARLTAIGTPGLLRPCGRLGKTAGSGLPIAHSRTALERLSPFLFIRWTRFSSSSHEEELARRPLCRVPRRRLPARST